MTAYTRFLGAACALALGTGAALADPALIFDLGGKFDKSFNEAGYNGAERWKTETGGRYRDFELQAEADRETALRRFADAGMSPIVVMSFSNEEVLKKVAPDYPNIKFALIDAVVDLPNVTSVLFSEHEGGYLVGILAAMASKSGTVGFIGGMDVPLIRKFGCGYAEGFLSVRPDGKVVGNMTGTTPAAWGDPVKGSELARAQMSQGADVIYAAAGGTGVGVLQAAADAGILSIGVDSNQNYMHPGKVLTSMLKRVDNAVFDLFSEGDNLQPGLRVMDLASGGVDYALDENNAALITDEMKAAVEAARAKIVSGEIKVHDYTSNDTCTFMTF